MREQPEENTADQKRPEQRPGSVVNTWLTWKHISLSPKVIVA
jgi:hypothetical protein